MTRVAVATIALALSLESAAAGGTSRHFSLDATKSCLSHQPIVKLATPGTLGEITVPALRIKLRTGNGVLLGFYDNASEAEDVLRQVKKYAKSSGLTTPASKFHTDGNVYVAWGDPPTRAESRAAEGCVR